MSTVGLWRGRTKRLPQQPIRGSFEDALKSDAAESIDQLSRPAQGRPPEYSEGTQCRAMSCEVALALGGFARNDEGARRRATAACSSIPAPLSGAIDGHAG